VQQQRRLAMAEIQDGKLIDGKVTIELAPKIEQGALKKVNAIVLHQTGGSSAKSTLESYKTSNIGAHFLIDKDGTIYQTARVDRIAFHVGMIRSKCAEAKNCSPEDQAAIKTILGTKETYKTKITNLYNHEMKKPYPNRFPLNEDSLGIEVVGNFKDNTYEDPTEEQAEAVKWLVAELIRLFGLTVSDVYRHPEVSYKQPSEAQNVNY
jgi:N-acetyl-anhydromuramyl-L-alanine amidase AmpD